MEKSKVIDIFKDIVLKEKQSDIFFVSFIEMFTKDLSFVDGKLFNTVTGEEFTIEKEEGLIEIKQRNNSTDGIKRLYVQKIYDGIDMYFNIISGDDLISVYFDYLNYRQLAEISTEEENVYQIKDYICINKYEKLVKYFKAADIDIADIIAFMDYTDSKDRDIEFWPDFQTEFKLDYFLGIKNPTLILPKNIEEIMVDGLKYSCETDLDISIKRAGFIWNEKDKNYDYLQNEYEDAVITITDKTADYTLNSYEDSVIALTDLVQKEIEIMKTKEEVYSKKLTTK